VVLALRVGERADGLAPGAGPVDNLLRYARFYALTSFAWDSFRAAGNAALVLALGRPALAALVRAARRMHLEIAPSTA
jgi:hypothetical protein